MKNSSIKRRKSNENGQTVVDVKDLSKKDTKVSFADEVNQLQLKLLSKEKNKKSKKKKKVQPSSKEDQIPLKNKRYSFSIPSFNFKRFNNQENNNNNSFKSNSNRSKLNSEENDKKSKYMSRRHSMTIAHSKFYEEKFAFKKNRGELAAIKEIIIPDNHESIVSNNPKKRFKINKDDDYENKNKKINIIEELRKFDREQQIKLEIYLENKRKKQEELMYKKSKIYKIINNGKKDESIIVDNSDKNNNSNNETESQENDENSESSNTIEKELKKSNKEKNSSLQNNNKENGKNLNNSKNSKNNDNTNNQKEDFQKLKEKYFSKNLFSTKFTETKYKIKYLDNYLQNVLSSNFFSNYVDEKNQNKNSNINQYNKNISIDMNKTPLTPKGELRTKSNVYNLKGKYNNINTFQSPKIIYKKSNETDATNTLFDSNNKYNNIEQSYNTNTYTIYTNKSFYMHKNEDEIDSTFKMIMDTIDEKLYDKKHKNKINLPYDNHYRGISASAGKLKTYSNYGKNTYRKNFRDIALLRKNNINSYYKDIYNKYESYHDSKMIPNFIKIPFNNNYNRDYNKEYKFLKIVREINNNIKSYKEKKTFPF